MTNHKDTHNLSNANSVAVESAELSEEQLDQVAGGFTPVPIPEKIAQPSSLVSAPTTLTRQITSSVPSIASLVKVVSAGGGGIG